jgi:hypothetical protein
VRMGRNKGSFTVTYFLSAFNVYAMHSSDPYPPSANGIHLATYLELSCEDMIWQTC